MGLLFFIHKKQSPQGYADLKRKNGANLENADCRQNELPEIWGRNTLNTGKYRMDYPGRQIKAAVPIGIRRFAKHMHSPGRPPELPYPVWE